MLHKTKTSLAALIALTLLACATTVNAADKRCGWLQNPTPANWYLVDRNGIWTLMEQGAGREPDGMDLIPDLSEHDYVETNGSYGYACACMSVETEGDHVTRILDFQQLTIAKCSRDPDLPKP